MGIRVLVVDDHAVVAETVRSALDAHDDMDVVGIAVTAAEGRRLAEEHRPDIALVDVSLPDMDGIRLVKFIRAASPGTRVVMLTGSTDPSLFPQAMAAGACGYLFKELSFRVVVDAIRRAHAGEVIVPDGVLGRLAAVQTPAKGIGSDLTRREAEVLALLAGGADPRSAASSLGVSLNTVRTYIKSLLMKFDAHSQLELVTKAIRLGVVKVDTADD